jgi:hypothetical protein
MLQTPIDVFTRARRAGGADSPTSARDGTVALLALGRSCWPGHPQAGVQGG